MTKPKLTYIWHFYHNQLMTAIFHPTPVKKRRITIKAIKPIGERPLRLRLLKVVKGKIPDRITKNQWIAYHDGRRCDLTNNKAVIALHKKECYKECPWNGNSIFPYPDKIISTRSI